MKKGIAKFTAFCLAAGMTLGEGGAVYFAAPADSETQSTSTSGVAGTTGFARCEEYLNVRASADTEGEVVGKIYNNGTMEILDVDEHGWYHVKSGNVEGYVAGQFVATGAEADAIAATAGYTTAEVGVEALNVRAAASTDSEIVTTVSGASEIEVVEDQGDWVKVVLDGNVYGYVSHDYVETKTSYATGETAEEEQARLDEQWIAYLASQGQTASDQTSTSYEQSTYSDTVYTESSTYTEEVSYTDTSSSYTESYTGSEDLNAAASSLYAVYLEAQQAADDAVANGADEQTIVDTCDAAQSAYAEYVQAQNAADEAAYAAPAAESVSYESYQSADSQSETYQDTSYTESYTDSSYTDSSDLSATASSLYAAYLEAQQAADNAVANGADEQTIIDTCDAAQNAYAVYVQAQNAADEAAYAYSAADSSTAASADSSAVASADSSAQSETYQESTYEESSSQDTSVQEETAAQEDSSTQETSTASSAGSAAASYALQFVGNPYVYGGSSLTSGADCSGFTMAVLSNFGVSLPHNAAAQSGYGTAVSMDDLQPGDLIFYGSGIGHVAMYIGGGQVVHASNPTNGILVSNYNYRTPVAARRYL